MCQQILILAERPGWRYISQCEHGTVHLVWDSIGIHLPAEPFGQLATRLLETLAKLQRYGAPRDHDHCRVQVGRAALTLALDDFMALMDMVEEALPQINQPDDPQRCAVPQRTLPWSPTRPTLN